MIRLSSADILSRQGSQELVVVESAGKDLRSMEGDPSASRRHSPAHALIQQYLGPGESGDGEVVWRINRFGRACILYLHRWNGGRETVTSMDSARESISIASHFDVSDDAGLRRLEVELKALTTHKGTTAPDPPVP
jgi:hypothetical protein